MRLENLIIQKDKTILEALQQLNGLLYISHISRLILFVVDNNQAVIGSLTDGDIRRSLISNADLNLKAEVICNKDFLFEYEKPGFLDLQDYRKKDIKILPILNANKKLIRIVDLDKTKAQLPLECMIMAGGRGKRLSPTTDTIPKPMLPLGEKPIIEHNIDRLISFGIKKIYISVKYLGDRIKEYFGDGSSKGISIEYIWEDKPLGTAGALSLVEKFNTEHILLMNSDLFTDVDFEDLYLDLIKQKADMDGRIINSMIDEFVKKYPEKAKAFTSLGNLRYLSFLKQCDAIIGNSSSGIIEAPSLKIHTINIGDRQKGRTQADSVINCDVDYEQIKKALSKIKNSSLKSDLETIKNPYGEGHTAPRIIKVLEHIS